MFDSGRSSTTPLYAISNAQGFTSGGRHWHIAAHQPSGYGLRALCGQSWAEGRFRTHGPGIAGPLCKRCKSIEENRAVGDLEGDRNA